MCKLRTISGSFLSDLQVKDNFTGYLILNGWVKTKEITRHFSFLVLCLVSVKLNGSVVSLNKLWTQVTCFGWYQNRPTWIYYLREKIHMLIWKENFKISWDPEREECLLYSILVSIPASKHKLTEKWISLHPFLRPLVAGGRKRGRKG